MWLNAQCRLKGFSGVVCIFFMSCHGLKLLVVLISANFGTGSPASRHFANGRRSRPKKRGATCERKVHDCFGQGGEVWRTAGSVVMSSLCGQDRAFSNDGRHNCNPGTWALPVSCGCQVENPQLAGLVLPFWHKSHSSRYRMIGPCC